MPSIFEKQQAIYLRFYFRDFRYGWGFAIQPRIPAWFCSRRPNRAFARGAGGAFLPRRPLFQLYSSATPVWFLPWESCPLRLEYGRCP